MMSVLLLTGPHAGNVHPTFSLVRELVRRGHQVTHLTTPEFAAAAAATGASVLAYDSVVADLDPAEVFGSGDPTLPHSLYLRENLQVLAAAEAAFDGMPPSVVLYEDSPFIAGKLLEHRWNRPAVRISVGFATNGQYSYYREMAEASGIPGPLEFEGFRDELAEVLRTRGVEPDLEEFWFGISDRNLVFIPRTFQFEGDSFDDRFRFVGPALEDRDDRWTPPDDRPVLLLSLGTSFNDHPEWFRTCVHAFADTRWRVVMTLGARVDTGELGPLPDNIEAHSWLPHHAVLEHARICVTHGGMGTVMQSLHWGTPMVTVPHYAFEVEPMARRIVELGLGRRIPAEQFDAAALRDTVEELDADTEVFARVGEMREHIREAGGAVRAADEVESWTRNTTAAR
ncbi:macrolide family glycosyltransferase [Saccharopolyspora sp. NPDC000359]|uniref:macrolide family glycosyltransferase n=1 Tax=Saccharopolyspora sp. NPDC000359 TaxID=3154251 RepID=UPI003329804B